MTALPYFDLSNRDLGRGRRLVKAGAYRPAKMLPMLDVLGYLEAERNRVAQRGQCGDGCARTTLIEHNGQMVCPWTLQHCPSRRLDQIVKLYERINAQ